MEQANFDTKIIYAPIGVIHSPYKESKGTPIQPVFDPDSTATVEIFPEYADGLTDIQGFSHLILIFHMHLAKKSQLQVIPFLGHQKRGIFATRAPGRPNQIGFSVVRLEKVDKNILFIAGIDIIDGSPLLDIKPFVPVFDVRKADRAGWIGEIDTESLTIKDDGRFC